MSNKEFRRELLSRKDILELPYCDGNHGETKVDVRHGMISICGSGGLGWICQDSIPYVISELAKIMAVTKGQM